MENWLRMNKYERCIEHVQEETKGKKEFIILIAHTGCYDQAVLIQDYVKKLIPNALRYEIFTIPPTVGAHVGSGILGVGYMDFANLIEKL